MLTSISGKQGVFMRTLVEKEIASVSGGDWSLGFDFGIIDGKISGKETIQDMASGVASAASGAYWGARDAFADFWTALDLSNYYNSGCAGGGGGGGGR
jgi:hypothetical protein